MSDFSVTHHYLSSGRPDTRALGQPGGFFLRMVTTQQLRCAYFNLQTEAPAINPLPSGASLAPLDVGERPQRRYPTRGAWLRAREAAMAAFAKSWRRAFPHSGKPDIEPTSP
jgi:hypothetical protein